MKKKSKPFRSVLKSERTRLGITQEQACEILSTPKRTYCDWEQGITSPSILAQEGAIARLAVKSTPTA